MINYQENSQFRHDLLFHIDHNRLMNAKAKAKGE
jgi:hypothetical protein